MAKKRLPTKPNTSTRYSLSEKERLALCCYCVFECTKPVAFSLAHPELSGTPNILRRKTEEFFMSSEVVGYITEYKAYLDSLNSTPEVEVQVEVREKYEKPKVSAEEREERKRKALEMLADDLVEQIFALRDGGEGIDRETVLKMVDRIGWLEEEEDKQEEPRRYLPESCSRCRYKIWIEENCDSTDK